MKRIVVAEEQDVLRAGLCAIILRHPDCEIVAEATDGRQAVQLARQHRPDLMFLNVSLPLISGIEAVQQILMDVPNIKPIMIARQCEEHTVTAALRAGASGFVLLHSAAAELNLAIRAACDGGTYLSPHAGQIIINGFLYPSTETEAGIQALTPKQRDVLRLLTEGMSNKEVAQRLCISCKTVEARRAQIMEKLKIRHMPGLTKYAIQQGLTTLEV